METKEIFKNRITQLRKEKGVTRQVAADNLAISRASLEYYEKGLRNPDICVLARIAEYYNVSADYLLGMSDIQKIDPNKQLNSVCEYTGLSEKSAETIFNISHNDKNVLQTVNFLLEQYSDKLSDKTEAIHKNMVFYFYEIDSVLHELSRYLNIIPSTENKTLYLSESGHLVNKKSPNLRDQYDEINITQLIERTLLDRLETSLKWAKKKFSGKISNDNEI